MFAVALAAGGFLWRALTEYWARMLHPQPLQTIPTMTVKFPNFHVDTSAYVAHRLPPAFVQWMKGLGQSRVMFGTNWPMLSPKQCLARLDDLSLAPEHRDAYLYGNARRVFAL
jgi:predicted TIM-barrel fold metal-dependent hydrolase